MHTMHTYYVSVTRIVFEWHNAVRKNSVCAKSEGANWQFPFCSSGRISILHFKLKSPAAIKIKHNYNWIIQQPALEWFSWNWGNVHFRGFLLKGLVWFFSSLALTRWRWRESFFLCCSSTSKEVGCEIEGSKNSFCIHRDPYYKPHLLRCYGYHKTK